MDFQSLALFALGISCAALGWFARELYTAIKKLNEDLSALRVMIAEDYVRYDKLDRALKPIQEVLAEIRHAVSQKQDKP